MSNQHLEATYSTAHTIVASLAGAGIRHVCICPGSRSTPLALAFARQSAIKLWMHIDERSAGFFAIGLARASAAPVALLCTSGTAAANFYPAVVEAHYARVPLIVLTADRPPELRENGAPQAIDQLQLYGAHAKWFLEMGLPEATTAWLRHTSAVVARAVATATAGPAGPVHLNMPFREPFVPVPDLADGEIPEHAQLPHAVSGARVTAAGAVADLAHRLVMSPRGLIVCGPQDDAELAAAVAALSAASGYPIAADPLSGLRHALPAGAVILDAYDSYLRDERLATNLAPEIVLRLGAVPTSKPLLGFLQRASYHVLIDGDGGWRDPASLANQVVHADAAQLCRDLAAALQGVATPSCAWSTRWQRIDRAARDAITTYLETLGAAFEGKVFAELAALLPDGATLFAGNSMPVRDLDTFFPAGDRAIRCAANRGANGIDGVVSTALGMAAGSPGPLVLVIGDLSFYHDLNGLLAARRHALDATIILLNNDGGGIFSFLPQAGYPEHFELLFGTPTGLDFAPAVQMYGYSFERPSTWDAFRHAVQASLHAPGVQVIELRTTRPDNVDLHRRLWPLVAEAVWRD